MRIRLLTFFLFVIYLAHGQNDSVSIQINIYNSISPLPMEIQSYEDEIKLDSFPETYQPYNFNDTLYTPKYVLKSINYRTFIDSIEFKDSIVSLQIINEFKDLQRTLKTENETFKYVKITKRKLKKYQILFINESFTDSNFGKCTSVTLTKVSASNLLPSYVKNLDLTNYNIWRYGESYAILRYYESIPRALPIDDVITHDIYIKLKE
jgi:hypothetical protein